MILGQPAVSCSLALGFASNRQEQFELWRKLVFGVEPVREIDSSNSAVGMDLNSKSLNIVGTVSSPGEIRQVKLNLVPALIESHRHGTDERLDSGGGLIVGSSESTSHGLVIQDLYLEGEVLLQVLDDHDQEGKLDGEGLLLVNGAGDEVGGDSGAHDLENGGLNISIR